MPDREKFIKGLNYCTHIDNAAECQNCPYWQGDNNCVDALIADALALLKEQEAVEPIEKARKIVCGSCGEKLAENLGDVNVVWNDDGEYPNFCPNCGRPVKWG